MFCVPENCRWNRPSNNQEYWSTLLSGNNGAFRVPHYKPGEPILRCIASDGAGWEHVSVSFPGRCPTWEEMCYIKNKFWDEIDWVVQFHPAATEYIDNHPHCLHLWRPVNNELLIPNSILVGIK